MEHTNAKIDPYLFERQFEAFRVFVEEKSRVPFVSFASHPYTEEQEGYKYDIYRAARNTLKFQAWTELDIGTGSIVTSTREAIEIPQNNLVRWHGQYGKAARPQQPLYDASADPVNLSLVEASLFKHFHESREPESFSELIEIFGRSYPLLAYLFFIKDRSRYLPLAPTYLDRSFKLLGTNFKTSHIASWENYSTYLKLISELRGMLTEYLATEVSLLDAHSFAWILAAQMNAERKTADIHEYLNLSDTERQAIVKARVGQGQFRDGLISYWVACAVTGCAEHALLRASHIKPWSQSSRREKLDIYNGILLTPTLDSCFDGGFISFRDTGQIMISPQLDEADMMALGIDQEMRLAKIEDRHKPYLAYHRSHIFLID